MQIKRTMWRTALAVTAGISLGLATHQVSASTSQLTADKFIGQVHYVPGYGINLWQVNGTQRSSNRNLPHGSRWQIFGRQTINGVNYDNLGGNQWVEARYIDRLADAAGSDMTRLINTKGTVAYVPGYGIAVYQLVGNTTQLVLGKKLADGTTWQVFGKKTLNGQLWYNLGGNQWANGTYLRLVAPQQPSDNTTHPNAGSGVTPQPPVTTPQVKPTQPAHQQVDKSALDLSLRKAETAQTANDTADSVAQLSAAINDAQRVMALSNPTQAQVANATATLDRAINGLTAKPIYDQVVIQALDDQGAVLQTDTVTVKRGQNTFTAKTIAGYQLHDAQSKTVTTNGNAKVTFSYVKQATEATKNTVIVQANDTKGNLIKTIKTIELDPSQLYYNVTAPDIDGYAVFGPNQIRVQIRGAKTYARFVYIKEIDANRLNALALQLQTSVTTAINNYRLSHGLAAYHSNQIMNQATTIRAQEQFVSYSHTRPNGQYYWSVAHNLGYPGAASNENLDKIAINVASLDTFDVDGFARRVVNDWSADDGHKDNMLAKEPTDVGVAVAIQKDASGLYYGAVVMEAAQPNK